MKPFPLFPRVWATFRDVNGIRHLFTHDNRHGNGWLTYTSLDWALRNRLTLTLEGAGVKLSKAEIATIRAQVSA